MGTVPPRIIPPYGYSTAEVTNAFAALLTPPWYSLAMTDEYGTSRYGTDAYDTKEQAESIARALQEAYARAGYPVVFGVRLRDMEEPVHAPG